MLTHEELSRKAKDALHAFTDSIRSPDGNVDGEAFVMIAAYALMVVKDLGGSDLAALGISDIVRQMFADDPDVKVEFIEHVEKRHD